MYCNVNHKNRKRRRHQFENTPFYNFVDGFLKDAEKSIENSLISKQPKINIVETADVFRLELATPGLSKKDFKIDLDKNKLTIKVEKEVATIEGENYKRREFDYNNFSKTFTLTDKIDTENVKAVFKNGILFITLHKKEAAKEKPARSIDIS